jgi:acyl-CoA thioester hydrolase
MTKEKSETRDRYPHFLAIETRWSDNDIYGHVNNVTYYSYFDTVVNRYLIDVGGLDINNDEIVGYTVETKCKFMKPLAFPEPLEAGLRVGKLGRSSTRYEIGIFRKGDNDAAASGHFVHVFVDHTTGKPVEIPGSIRNALEKILSAA